MDGEPGHVAGGPSTRLLWYCGGCPNVSRIQMPFVHKYRVYKDPFPHLALRGGVLPRSLSFVTRAMAVALLKNLHISIPASGASPGEVPEECFPRGVPSRGLTYPHRVSFASGVTVLGDDPLVDKSPDIQIHAPVCPDIVEDEDMDSVEAVIDVPVPVLRPPPGFERFSWPWEEWGPNGNPPLFDVDVQGRTGASRLIRCRCRSHQYFGIAWMTQLWQM